MAKWFCSQHNLHLTLHTDSPDNIFSIISYVSVSMTLYFHRKAFLHLGLWNWGKENFMARLLEVPLCQEILLRFSRPRPFRIYFIVPDRDKNLPLK